MQTKEAIITQIKGQGERVTLPRQAVIDALCHLGGHQTMRTLQSHLIEQGVDMPESTVYRVLQWLKDLGIVAQTDLGQSGITYELVSTPPHHHLVCLICGTVQAIEDTLMQPVRDELSAQHGFLPRIDHMAFFGICQSCQAQPFDRRNIHDDE